MSSLASINPAGNSIVYAFTGGRNCLTQTISSCRGFVGLFFSIANITTASIESSVMYHIKVKKLNKR